MSICSWYDAREHELWIPIKWNVIPPQKNSLVDFVTKNKKQKKLYLIIFNFVNTPFSTS